TKEPDKNYILPFGKARIVTEGNDISIITWGAMVQKSLDAIKSQELPDGIVDVIDLRTLNPLDIDTIRTSIEKTGKVLIVYEDNLTNGPGAEISAIIADRFFELLDGPVCRVAAKDAPIPFSPFLEKAILPQTNDIIEALLDLIEY
ncbi:MAG: transketolase C-terminal domain-containing protein, partial [Candidatus Neomarinimicrobiota bacterium]|nr:transketolase C-terminal domain-containing protein [Candidatus Neomarinimicrobiota bacterium]